MPKKGSINPPKNDVRYKEVVDQSTGEVERLDIYVNGRYVTSQDDPADARQMAEAFRRPAKGGYTVRPNGLQSDIINQATGSCKGSYGNEDTALKVVNKLNKMAGYEQHDPRNP